MIRMLSFAALAVLAALPAVAQYKVVGPDGKVTYTDRPPTEQPGNVTSLRGSPSGPAPSATPLPAELRSAVQRFPVVLYTATSCTPCDDARQMLKKRGIPLTERQVQSGEDLPALERATGSRSVPALMVGGQTAAGYSESQWNNLLDLAGYPRESRLPRDYASPPPVPLVTRQATAPAPAPRPTPEAPAVSPPVAEPASGIRF